MSTLFPVLPRAPRGAARSRRFTLIELLVVIGIVTILVGFTLGGLSHSKIVAERARAETQLKVIQAALTMYSSDLRIHPVSQPGDTPETLLADHGHYLYAAMQNRATPLLGGGPNSPYVKGSEIKVGAITDRAALGAFPMGSDGEPRVRELSSHEAVRLSLPEFQQAHHAASAEPLVFLDPWGNPWHARIWIASDSAATKALVSTPVRRTGFAPNASMGGGQTPVEEAFDRPHDRYGVDLWSNGPNGVNEFGAGDDIKSW